MLASQQQQALHREGHWGTAGCPGSGWEDEEDEIAADGVGLSPERGRGARGCRGQHSGFGAAEPALPAPAAPSLWRSAALVPGSGASELRNSPLPLAAGGRRLFLLALAGLVSHTKHLYFLLIKLSPGARLLPLASPLSWGRARGRPLERDAGVEHLSRAGQGVPKQSRDLHAPLPAEMQTAEM